MTKIKNFPFLSFITKNTVIAVLGILAAIAISIYYFPLKKLGYNNVPPSSDIFDERANVYAGISFLNTGVPTGWSILDSYRYLEERKNYPQMSFNGISLLIDDTMAKPTNKSVFHYPITSVQTFDFEDYDKNTIQIVQPYIDHSPLGGIIYSLGHRESIQTVGDIVPSKYRLNAIYLSVITGILLFLVSYLFYKNVLLSLFILLIYSTVPTYIFSARYALLENVLVPFLLLTLLFLRLSKLKFQHINSNLFLVLAGISTGLSILAKESGISVMLMGFTLVYLYNNKQSVKLLPRKMLLYGLPTILVAASFYLYAFYLSPALFKGVYLNQYGREFFGPMNFLQTLRQLSFNKFAIDGFWIYGFASLLLLWKYKDENTELFVGLGSTLFVYLIFGGINYPWYSIPFIPFLCIASGVILWKTLVKPNAMLISLFFLIPFSSSMYWGYVVHREGVSIVSIYRLFLLIFSMFAILISSYHLLPKKLAKYNNLINRIWIIFFLIIFYQILQWNTQSVEYMVFNWGQLPNLFSIN